MAVAFVLCAAVGDVRANTPPIPFGADPLLDTGSYALGSYTVNVIFIEDAVNTWSPGDLTGRTAELANAASWWQSQTSALHPTAQLSMSLNFLNAGQPVAVDSVGGGLGDPGSELFVNQVMADLGYLDPDPFNNVAQFNHDQRTLNQTHWSFTQFIKPTTGGAYSYLNGPFSVGFENDLAWTYTHEWAHQFGAIDEFNSFTDDTGGYLNFPNGNAHFLPDGVTVNPALNTDSLMHTFGSTSVNPFTHGQIGTADTDGDTIPDILDTLPLILPTLVQASPTDGAFSFDGALSVDPLESLGLAITINTISDAKFRLDGQPWESLPALDGVFDGYTEDLAFGLSDLPAGEHTLDLRVTNSVGNTADWSHTFVSTLIPLIGDLNADGFVGVEDLGLVLARWNQPATPGDLLLGDPSGDGFVGIEDINLVLGNWNAGTPPGPPPGIAANIPEPGAACTLIVLGLLWPRTGRRR